ncbi:membrane protein [Gordonia phage Hexbug]|nr:membrane protein [Gordonia phage Orla]UVK62980.1 membrane protein [Gordonia phage Hexbug]WNN96159.1 hypothetical protein SEA_NODIGI_68 [Gordonia phage Nodigi]
MNWVIGALIGFVGICMWIARQGERDRDFGRRAS